MFRHVVLLKWSDDSTADQHQSVVDALRGLPAAIPELRSYVLGDDVGVDEGNFSLAIVADFDDVEGYLVYRDHPVHQAVIRELIVPIRESRSAVQYQF